MKTKGFASAASTKNGVRKDRCQAGRRKPRHRSAHQHVVFAISFSRGQRSSSGPDAVRLDEANAKSFPPMARLTKRREVQVRSLSPLSGRGRPQTAHRQAQGRANSSMADTALHAARIIRPLDRVHRRVETRANQIAQMLPPAVFRSHRRLLNFSPSTPSSRSRFLRSCS